MRRQIKAEIAVVDAVIERSSWQRIRTAAARNRRQTTSVNFSEYTPDKYVLSHNTIVSGVKVEDNEYWIVPEHSEIVNENGNAWDNEILLNTYKTFIMGENYVEHIQRKDLSRGKILDAVARKVNINGVPTIYIDILVATSRKHKDLCARIEAGLVNKMSMGCSVTHTRCSVCGKTFEDDEEDCIHLSEQILQYFQSEDGVRRRVAELCGVRDLPDSNVFTEASWVYDPAFGGAESRGLLKIGLENANPLDKVVMVDKIVHASRKRAASKKQVTYQDLFR